jgi:hypothetical protein
LTSLREWVFLDPNRPIAIDFGSPLIVFGERISDELRLASVFLFSRRSNWDLAYELLEGIESGYSWDTIRASNPKDWDECLVNADKQVLALLNQEIEAVQSRMGELTELESSLERLLARQSEIEKTLVEQATHSREGFLLTWEQLVVEKGIVIPLENFERHYQMTGRHIEFGPLEVLVVNQPEFFYWLVRLMILEISGGWNTNCAVCRSDKEQNIRLKHVLEFHLKMTWGELRRLIDESTQEKHDQFVELDQVVETLRGDTNLIIREQLERKLTRMRA